MVNREFIDFFETSRLLSVYSKSQCKTIIKLQLVLRSQNVRYFSISQHASLAINLLFKW